MSKEKGFSNAEILWFDLVGHFTHVLSQPHDLLFAALKPGFQDDSFEYNYVEFEDENCLTERRAMSDLNGQILDSSAHVQWHSNTTTKVLSTYIFLVDFIFSPAYRGML